MKKTALDWIALVLVIIGAINWGLVGAFNGFSIVDALFSSASWLKSLIYVLIGLSGLYLIYYLKR
ncbi:MAG: uncharacterized membrane protein YuzA (DUF378 family) [Candidatus Woesearchaeota archaeon]|jgi:uncharacterized membrane protein YuzA (DUF378 family)